MQLFYNPNLDINTVEFHLEKEESKHLIKVFRKSMGDTFHITNGKGWLFTAEICLANLNKCRAKVISKTLQEKHNYHLHLAVAPTKMNERFEWFLEKATEIGIDTITPLICDHSERKIIKLDRYERVLQAAMKQSLHCYLPKLNEATRYRDFINQNFKGPVCIAHCEKTEKKPLKTILTSNSDMTILIGPEGDFSVKEIEMALQNNFIPVTLGSTRLRTETAAIVACHSVAFKNE